MSRHRHFGHIVLMASRKLQEARASYKESYGVTPEDVSIDRDLERLFKAADLGGEDEVSLPLPIALGLLLRGSKRRGRGHQSDPNYIRRRKEATMKAAWSRRAELRSINTPPSKASQQAAQELATRSKLSKQEIERRLNRGKPRPKK